MNDGSDRDAPGGVNDPLLTRPALPPPSLPPVLAAAPTAPRTPRRVKPARSSKVAALALSVASTGGLAAWFAHDDRSAQAGAAVVPDTSAATSPTTPALTTPGLTVPGLTTPEPSVTAAPTTPTTGIVSANLSAITGTFDGAAEPNRWGTVQVEVVFDHGVITDVVTLQSPDGHGRSVAINQRALPELRDEALQAQSAAVDTVSGATYTSDGYSASLQSAIDAAKRQFGIS